MYCGIPFQSHSRAHTPLHCSRLVHAVSVCFIVDLARRQSGPPATTQGTVCTVNLAPAFFSFLCCLFSDNCLTAVVVVAVLFCAFFSSCEASHPGVWVEVHCGEGLIMEKCACVFFSLRFKVNMVWELLGSEAAQY